MDPNAVSAQNTGLWLLPQIVIPLLAGLGGAGLGGLMTMSATKKGIKMDHERRTEDQKAALQNFYHALLTEIETVWSRYYKVAGVLLENLPDGSSFQLPYPVTQEHFIIYKNNSLLIGMIPDNMLRESIIKTYSNAIGMVESFNFNNIFLEKWSHWGWIVAETGKPIYKARADAIEACLVEFAKGLVVGHNTLKENVQQLIELLKKNITNVSSR